MSSRKNREMLSTAESAQQLFDQTTRQDSLYQVLNSNVQTTIDNPSTDIQKNTDNTINLDSGDRNGLIITTSTTIVGTSGTKMLSTVRNQQDRRTASLLIQTDNIVVHVSNVHFVGSVNIFSPSGVVADMPTAIFRNCIFDEGVACSGKVHYIGCEFRGAPSTTATSGAANNIIIGCSNKGGIHVGAHTIIAETT